MVPWNYLMIKKYRLQKRHRIQSYIAYANDLFNEDQVLQHGL